MFRARAVLAMPVAFAAVLGADATHAVADCVTAFGLENCALGQATLSLDQGDIVVSNIGSSGDDGVTLTPFANGVSSVMFTVATDSVPALAAGDYFEVVGSGQVNGVADQPTGLIRHEIISGPMLQLTPDFAAVGAATYTLQLFDGSTLVYEETGKSGPAVRVDPASGCVCDYEYCCEDHFYYCHVEILVLFVVVGGPSVSATEVRAVAESPTGEVAYFTSGSIRAAGLATFSVKDEQLGPAVDADMLADHGVPTGLGSNSPNPFVPSTSIPLNLPVPTRGVVSVYSVDGRLLRTLAEGTLPAGTSTLIWDGRDYRGRRVASGVYFVRLRSEHASDVETVTLLK